MDFVALRSVEDLDAHEGYDLVVSRIVLQHNPPPVMAALFRRLLRSLAPGGVAVIQLPTFIAGQRFSAAEYLANEQPMMEMHALPQKAVFEIIAESNCRALEVREDGSIGDYPGLSHVFAITKL